MNMKKDIMHLIIFSLLFISCNSNQPKDDIKIIKSVEQEVPKAVTKETTVSAIVEINTDSITFKGISLHTSKKLILKHLGKPDKIIESKYDCGAYSEAWQEMKFYQYFYEQMNFIIDEEDYAIIEQLYFKNDNTIKINNVFFDKSSTFKEVIDALGIEPNENYDETIIFLLPMSNLDEDYLLRFENGKLSKFEINTSC